MRCAALPGGLAKAEATSDALVRPGLYYSARAAALNVQATAVVKQSKAKQSCSTSANSTNERLRLGAAQCALLRRRPTIAVQRYQSVAL